MDFVPVPAGTADAAALTLRGSDPDIVFAQTSGFNTTLGDALAAQPGAAAADRQAAYSDVAGALTGGLFTRDPLVLQSLVHAAVVGPAKLYATFLRLVHDGLDDATPLSLKEFRAAREVVIEGLDLGNLDAAYLVEAADLVDTEAPAGALGGNGTLYLRSIQIQYVPCPGARGGTARTAPPDDAAVALARTGVALSAATAGPACAWLGTWTRFVWPIKMQRDGGRAGLDGVISL